MDNRIRARLVSVVVFGLCCLSFAPAWADGRLIITTDRPIAVFLDGEILPFVDGTTRVEKLGILPGRHLVEFRAVFGKLIDSAEVSVPEGDAVVRARWANRQFEVYETLVLAPEPLPAERVLVEVSAGPLVGGSLR
ncbi:MAG: hypothetical protein VX498_13035, partial [Myxococcota bacterium]|nr:hypothetical protein [Myxococcota bacterium]